MGTLKDLLTEAKSKSKAKGETLGHVTEARKIIRALKKEVGPEEFAQLTPAPVVYVVCETVKKEKPALWKQVQERVGLKRFKMEITNLFYREK